MPGSVVSGNALYLGICVARILAKMVLPELPPGEHFWQHLSLLTDITDRYLYVLLLKEDKIFMRNAGYVLFSVSDV
ncbi:MAG: hypothetical protein CSA31_00495 [Desulfobulbus propionicus]|nr:MAG: hypothetical protein CSA31_00495 [Desulfobulbus propionicus]